MLPVSIILSTYRRRDVLLRTLARLHQPAIRELAEIFVVDNASGDGTPEAVRERFPSVHLIALSENRGSVAKNLAIPHARGRYVLFLDDDSYPVGDSLRRMVQHLDADPALGAALFRVTLPDGSQECSAYPDVFVGCGVGLRRRALEQVGCLPDDFFMQAEEYDLSLRLLDGGWKLRRFEDLHVEHLKTPGARFSARVMRLDVRNNLTLIARRFPEAWRRPFAREWLRRYWAIASSRGLRWPFVMGLCQGLARAIAGKSHPISDGAFEQFSRMGEIEDRLRQAKSDLGLRRILLVDWGKNLLAYWLAARACGLEVVAIADNRLAGPRASRYRGIPILKDEEAAALPFDAAVIANSSPVHAQARRRRWMAIDRRPIIDLLESGDALPLSASGPAAREFPRTAARSA